MKKTVILTIISIIFMFSLVACGENANSSNSSLMAKLNESTLETTSINETTTILESSTVKIKETTKQQVVKETTKPKITAETTTPKVTTKHTTVSKAVETTVAATTHKTTTIKKATTPKETQDPDAQIIVYITSTGECYHNEDPCGRGTYYPCTLAEAKKMGLRPCKKCVLH
jgi:hypothetical protein